MAGSNSRGKNQKLIDARKRLTSASGDEVTPQDIAEAMNALLWERHQKTKDSPRPTTLDHRYVSSYEAGRHWWPTTLYRAAWRHALRVETDAELGFTPKRRRQRTPAPTTQAAAVAVSAVAERSVGGQAVPDLEPSVDAAEELQQTHQHPGTSTWPPEWADQVLRGVANPAQHAKLDFLDVVRLQLETAKMLDGRYGAAAALATANGVIDVVESVTPDVSEGMRTDVLALGAEAAEFVGWLFRDLADIVQARYWYERAMEYAQMCGDLSMQGFVLLRKSQMAYESRSGHHVRRLAQPRSRVRGCFHQGSTPRLCSKVRAEISWSVRPSI